MITIKQLSIFLENKNGRINDVAKVLAKDTPGSLSAVLDYLAAENIFIEYMYAFSEGDTARTIIRPTDLKKCIEILQKNHCKIIDKYNI